MLCTFLVRHFIKWLEKVKVASFDKLNLRILTLQVNDMEFVGRGRGNYEKQQRTHVDGYRCRPKNTQKKTIGGGFSIFFDVHPYLGRFPF